MQPNVAKVSNFKDVLIQQAYPSLFIYNNYINDELAQITAASNGFALVKTNKETISSNNLVQIAQWNVAGCSYSLLKRVIDLMSVDFKCFKYGCIVGSTKITKGHLG